MLHAPTEAGSIKNHDNESPRSPQPVSPCGPVDRSSWVTTLEEMFPDAAVQHLERVASENSSVEACVNHLLELNGNYEKRPIPTNASVRDADSLEGNACRLREVFPQAPECFVWACLRKAGNILAEAAGMLCENVRLGCTAMKNPCPMQNEQYKQLSMAHLQNMFRKIHSNDIRKFFMVNGCSFIRTVAALRKLENEKSRWADLGFSLMPKPRKTVDLPDVSNADFAQELAQLKEEELRSQEAADRKVAEELNRELCQADGNGIPCGTCLYQLPFEEMMQCHEGHLFCVACTQQWVETCIGEGRPCLRCMEHGCDAEILRSQLQQRLPAGVMSAFDKTAAAHCVSKVRAENPNLLSCPFCVYTAEVVGEKSDTFMCRNTECGKESCVHCKSLAHAGQTCEQVAQARDEEQKRLAAEMAATEACIRSCPKCEARFCKEAGCNKITCNCGHIICWVCRKSIAPTDGYAHFTNTQPPPPGCCPLWDPDNHTEIDAAADAAGGSAETPSSKRPLEEAHGTVRRARRRRRG